MTELAAAKLKKPRKTEKIKDREIRIEKYKGNEKKLSYCQK